MKKRLIFAIILFVLLCAVCLPVAYYLHAVLSRQTLDLSFQLGRIVSGVFHTPMLLRLWLLMCALCALFCVWAIVGSSYLSYKNGMYQVTPLIPVPLPAGNGEYGTAWWMSERQLRQSFAEIHIPKDCLAELLRSGEMEYNEVEQLRQQGVLDAEAGLNGRSHV